MNRFTQRVILSLIVLTSLIGCAHNIITDDDAAKTVTSFHDALKSGDRDKVISLLSKDVQIYEGGEVERSAKEYAGHHLDSDIGFMSKMKIDLIEHQVKIFGDTAISTSRSKIKGIYKKKKIDIQSMETIILRKIEGTWKIINIHWS